MNVMKRTSLEVPQGVELVSVLPEELLQTRTAFHALLMRADNETPVPLGELVGLAEMGTLEVSEGEDRIFVAWPLTGQFGGRDEQLVATCEGADARELLNAIRGDIGKIQERCARLCLRFS